MKQSTKEKICDRVKALKDYLGSLKENDLRSYNLLKVIINKEIRRLEKSVESIG